MKIPQHFAEGPIPDTVPMQRVPQAPGPGLDALPRSLPLATPDIGGESAFNESLARSGQALAQLGTNAMDAFNAAAKKKQDAAEHVEGVEKFQAAKSAVEAQLAELEKDPPSDYRSRVEKLLVETEQSALKGTTSARVQQYLQENFARFRGDVASHATQFENKDLLDKSRASFEREWTDLRRDLTAKTGRLDMYDEKFIDAKLAKRREFGMSATEAAKDKQTLLKDVRIGRAKNFASVNPVAVLGEIRDGKYNDLDTVETRELHQYAENVMKQKRAEAEHDEAILRRDMQRQSDKLERDWRVRILDNYAPGGPNKDLEREITLDAEQLGSKFDNVVAAHTARRNAFLRPEKRTTSDKPTLIQAQGAISEGSAKSLAAVTQVDLDRWFAADQLSEPDYQGLSRERSSRVQALQAQAEKGQTEAEKQRDEETRDAAKVLDSFLTRGSRYAGDSKGADVSRRADIVIDEAKAELHRRVRLEPKMKPSEIADEIIERRIAEVERIAEGLIYKTPQEVSEAYFKNEINRASAERYWRILSILGQNEKNPAAGWPRKGKQ